jgi:kynureninase
MNQLQLEAERLDAADPLRHLRDAFVLPQNKIYLDGNSLGALPKRVLSRLDQTLNTEWGKDLISSWNQHAWIDLPARVGAKIAPLIGARATEVLACDSTSVNLFKVLLAALECNPERNVIVSDIDNFPSDLYVAQGIRRLFGDRITLRFKKRDQIEDALTDDVAVLLLTEVDYRTGERLDMRAWTARAHAVGALSVWDLAHSAGAFEVALNDCDADFAIGCGYKYLNGGPGAPAFLFVAQRHQARISPTLAGWMGHAQPFAFAPDYEPAPGIQRFSAGTPSILGLSALDAALEVFEGVDMTRIEAKSRTLTGLLIEAMEPLKAHGFKLLTPLEPAKRGSQVSYAHEHGYAIMRALISRGVVGDFRAPNIMRFGFAPLYLSHQDVVSAVDVIKDIMTTGAWQNPEFAERLLVT